MTPKLPPAIHIESDEALQQLVESLADESLIAVDTESNNLYAYRTRVCLIQLSTRTQDYIIDPLAIENMQPLGLLLEDENIEKVFHAAEYDLICLGRDFGFEIANLFDTMYAARLCHIKKFGLADLLMQFFDVDVDKRHQLDDWGKRPLKPESLHYAQMDTHYLPQLRDILRAQLSELNRLEEADEVFEDVLRVEIKEKEFDPEGFWKIGIPRSLTRKQMAQLREVYLLRERIAQEEDMPPFKVLSNNALVTIVRKHPNSYDEMYRMRHVPPAFVRRHADEVFDALAAGRGKKISRPPQRNTPAPDVVERYTILHQWRKERAMGRDLDSSLVLSKDTLWTIAYEMPSTKEELQEIEGIGEWRLNYYGDELLDLIDSMR